jgi:cardiolipin synthase
VRLLIQPEDGVLPVVKGISGAKKSVEIVIFRFDQTEIERALGSAVSRGVSVHALIASTNSSGEENLRKLELRLLAAGVTVARTADDLVRYHGKLMIIDRRELYLMAFNLTHADIDRSRSFGVVTNKRDIVHEAVRLFEADTKRTAYEPSLDNVVVSPANARKVLARFIRQAKKELIVYDPMLSDRMMVRLLAERAKAGVGIRVLGRLVGQVPGATARKLTHIRLHTRTIVRDAQVAFVGSQSLREQELDARRELGLIFRDPRAVSSLVRTFEDDWSQEGRASQDAAPVARPTAKIVRKVAKAVARKMPPVAPIVNGALKDAVGDAEVEIIQTEVEEAVKGAVQEALEEVVRDAVEEAVEKDAADK